MWGAAPRPGRGVTPLHPSNWGFAPRVQVFVEFSLLLPCVPIWGYAPKPHASLSASNLFILGSEAPETRNPIAISNPLHPRRRRKVAARVETSRGLHSNIPPNQRFQPQRSFRIVLIKRVQGLGPGSFQGGIGSPEGLRGGNRNPPLGPLAQRSAFLLLTKQQTPCPPPAGHPSPPARGLGQSPTQPSAFCLAKPAKLWYTTSVPSERQRSGTPVPSAGREPSPG